VIKLLSEDPQNYNDAPLEGIRRLLSKFTGKEIPRGQPLDTSKIESIRMGTTVATNALLERKGQDIAMVVTKGFKDCLERGRRSTRSGNRGSPWDRSDINSSILVRLICLWNGIG